MYRGYRKTLVIWKRWGKRKTGNGHEREGRKEKKSRMRDMRKRRRSFVGARITYLQLNAVL